MTFHESPIIQALAALFLAIAGALGIRHVSKKSRRPSQAKAINARIDKIEKRLTLGNRRFDELEDLHGLTLALLVERNPQREQIVAMAKEDFYHEHVRPRLDRLQEIRRSDR